MSNSISQLFGEEDNSKCLISLIIHKLNFPLIHEHGILVSLKDIRFWNNQQILFFENSIMNYCVLNERRWMLYRHHFAPTVSLQKEGKMKHWNLFPSNHTWSVFFSLRAAENQPRLPVRTQRPRSKIRFRTAASLKKIAGLNWVQRGLISIGNLKCASGIEAELILECIL